MSVWLRLSIERVAKTVELEEGELLRGRRMLEEELAVVLLESQQQQGNGGGGGNGDNIPPSQQQHMIRRELALMDLLVKRARLRELDEERHAWKVFGSVHHWKFDADRVPVMGKLYPLHHRHSSSSRHHRHLRHRLARRRRDALKQKKRERELVARSKQNGARWRKIKHAVSSVEATLKPNSALHAGIDGVADAKYTACSMWQRIATTVQAAVRRKAALKRRRETESARRIRAIEAEQKRLHALIAQTEQQCGTSSRDTRIGGVLGGLWFPKRVVDRASSLGLWVALRKTANGRPSLNGRDLAAPLITTAVASDHDVIVISEPRSGQRSDSFFHLVADGGSSSESSSGGASDSTTDPDNSNSSSDEERRLRRSARAAAASATRAHHLSMMSDDGENKQPQQRQHMHDGASPKVSPAVRLRHMRALLKEKTPEAARALPDTVTMFSNK
jgi:hypothetical protein